MKSESSKFISFAILKLNRKFLIFWSNSSHTF